MDIETEASQRATTKGMTTMANKGVKISMGTKKRTFPSIREAAMKVAGETGEPVSRVYMRLYMRYRKLGWKGVTAVGKKARRYNKRAMLQLTYQPGHGGEVLTLQ